MTELPDLGMLLIENNRSRAYLQRMAHHGLIPSFVILLENQSKVPLPGQNLSDLSNGIRPLTKNSAENSFTFDPGRSVRDTIQDLGISFQALSTADVNAEEVLEAVGSRKESVWVYSGPGGAIVKKPLLALGKRFLHIHPGLVPEYRGSTTIYYSLLQEGRCGASAIFLSPAIDEGPLLRMKEYPGPLDRKEIDYIYDPSIRSDLLVEVLQRYLESGEFKTSEQSGEGNPYYIMHPVLRHLCILGSNHNSDDK